LSLVIIKMKTINSFKLIWIGLGVVLIGGIIVIGMVFANQSVDDKGVKKQITTPEYKPGKIPGEIITKFSKPDLPEEEYSEKYENMSFPVTDSGLFEGDTPLAGSSIKVPDEPALPPSEEDIVNINISEGSFSLFLVKTEKENPVILRVSSSDKDYYFYVEGLGIAETIRTEKSLVISFKAPNKKSELKYWVEYADVQGETDAGTLYID